MNRPFYGETSVVFYFDLLLPWIASFNEQIPVDLIKIELRNKYTLQNIGIPSENAASIFETDL